MKKYKRIIIAATGTALFASFQTQAVIIKSRDDTQSISIDITPIVKNWASGVWNNYGFMLSPASFKNPKPGRAALATTTFCSQEYCRGGKAYYPQLIIEYMQ